MTRSASLGITAAGGAIITGGVLLYTTGGPAQAPPSNFFLVLDFHRRDTARSGRGGRGGVPRACAGGRPRGARFPALQVGFRRWVQRAARRRPEVGAPSLRGRRRPAPPC